MSAPTARRGPQGGPPPLAPALAYGALLIASVAVWIGAPQAGASAASTLSYAQAHTGQMHVEAVLVFGAALPLAIWAATIYRRLRTLGVTAPGAVIGLAGGRWWPSRWPGAARRRTRAPPRRAAGRCAPGRSSACGPPRPRPGASRSRRRRTR